MFRYRFCVALVVATRRNRLSSLAFADGEYYSYP